MFFKTETLGGNVGLAITQVLNLIFFCQWGKVHITIFIIWWLKIN